MTNQQTTLQFYGADESAPPVTLGHALAAFDRLLAADLEFDFTLSKACLTNLDDPRLPAIRKAHAKASAERAEAIRACKELRK